MTGQSLGSSRTQILGNFTNYNNLVSVDHVAPNDVDQGQHLQVTFNDFGDFASYVTAGNQSFLYSFDGSNSGSNLVYQPSIVTQPTKVPVTPRAVCRVAFNGATWSLSANGPYGANSTFNVGSITSTSTSQFTVNFTNNLGSSDYFVMYSVEGTTAGLNNMCISTKAIGSFVVKIQVSVGVQNIAFMVY